MRDRKSPVETQPEPAEPGGKGRATPKQREAQKRRAPVTAPTNRREAARRSRTDGAKRRGDARRALLAGDERALPARDKGPVRRYVRDWVDGRITLSEFLLPAAFVLYLPALLTHGSLRNSLSYMGFLLVIAILTELALRVVQLRTAVNRTFPQGGPGRRGAIAYGAMRLASLRKFRLPRAAVGRGKEPRAPH